MQHKISEEIMLKVNFMGTLLRTSGMIWCLDTVLKDYYGKKAMFILRSTVKSLFSIFILVDLTLSLHHHHFLQPRAAQWLLISSSCFPFPLTSVQLLLLRVLMCKKNLLQYKFYMLLFPPLPFHVTRVKSLQRKKMLFDCVIHPFLLKVTSYLLNFKTITKLISGFRKSWSDAVHRWEFFCPKNAVEIVYLVFHSQTITFWLITEKVESY